MKHILLIAINLLLFFKSNAQFVNGFGLKSGLSISEVEWSNGFSPDMDQRYGISTFVFMNFATQKYWRLSLNLGYVQKGCLLHETMRDLEGNIIIDQKEINSFDFLHFSPKLQLFCKINSFRPTLSIGPSIEYLAFHNGVSEYYKNESIKEVHYNADISLGLFYEFESFAPFIQITKQVVSSPIVKDENLNVNINSLIINFGIEVEISR